jgi:hypothetical protein
MMTSILFTLFSICNTGAKHSICDQGQKLAVCYPIHQYRALVFSEEIKDIAVGCSKKLEDA